MACLFYLQRSVSALFFSLSRPFFPFSRPQLPRAWNRRSIKQPPLLGELVKTTTLEEDPPLGGGWGSITYLQTLPTTFYWLLNLS